MHLIVDLSKVFPLRELPLARLYPMHRPIPKAMSSVGFRSKAAACKASYRDQAYRRHPSTGCIRRAPSVRSRELRRDFSAAVRAIVIDEDDLNVGVTLLDDRKHRGLQHRARIETSNHDRNKRQSWSICGLGVGSRSNAPLYCRELFCRLCRRLLAFPNGRHDDQVDSDSQFLLWWQSHRAHDHVPIVVPFIASRPRRFP